MKVNSTQNSSPCKRSHNQFEAAIYDCVVAGRAAKVWGFKVLRLHAQAAVDADCLRVDHSVAHDGFHLLTEKVKGS